MADESFIAPAGLVILEGVRDGLFPGECAEAAGITQSRLEKWENDGAKGLGEGALEDEAHPLHRVTVWYRALRQAESRYKREILRALHKRAGSGDVQAIKFLLTHRGRDSWHKRESKQVAQEQRVKVYFPNKTKVAQDG